MEGYLKSKLSDDRNLKKLFDVIFDYNAGFGSFGAEETKDMACLGFFSLVCLDVAPILPVIMEVTSIPSYRLTHTAERVKEPLTGPEGSLVAEGHVAWSPCGIP